MKNKVLILGSSGMAGYVIKTYLEDTLKYEIYDIARSNKYFNPYFLVDLLDFNVFTEILNSHSFDYIINCVGILNKNSEENPNLAILLNSYLPHFLEAQTKNSKTKIIHISTDCVFSGEKGNYYEYDLRDGIGFYAQSKALGELNNNKDLTIRTSIIGPDLKNDGIGLFNWIIRQNGDIYGYTNAYWSGVTTLELAKYILSILQSKNFPTGLIHLTNNTKISKYNLLKIIKEIFNLDKIFLIESDKHKVDKSLINSRNDLDLNVPSYFDMIIEMKEWMKLKNIKINP
jgi:dTDP-4-dehydrorhamnose reductase